MKKKKNIVCDLDDFLLPYVPNLIQWTWETKGKRINIEDFTSYNFIDAFKISQEEMDILTTEFESSNFFREIKVSSSKAIAMLFALKGVDLCLNILTARTSLLRGVTEYQIQNNFPGIFERIDFSRGEGNYLTARPKGDVICEIYEKSTIIGFGDDSPSHALNVRKNLPHTFTALLRQNWNRDHTETYLKDREISLITKHEQFTEHILARIA